MASRLLLTSPTLRCKHRTISDDSGGRRPLAELELPFLIQPVDGGSYSSRLSSSSVSSEVEPRTSLSLISPEIPGVDSSGLCPLKEGAADLAWKASKSEGFGREPFACDCTSDTRISIGIASSCIRSLVRSPGNSTPLFSMPNGIWIMGGWESN
jgi:hypothetical protein